MNEDLIFELSGPGKRTQYLMPLDVPAADPARLFGAAALRQTPLELPEVGESELVRHFTRLSQKNFCVDSGFYPLGSCTMKYNPKIDEDLAALPGFTEVHPLAPAAATQGILGLLHNFEQYLGALFGYDNFTFQPAAGAHGELTGLLVIRAYHLDQGQPQRNIVLVPDTSHGTNPASSSLAGWQTVVIPSDQNGQIDLASLKSKLAELGGRIAALMLTNPSTLGLFEEKILEVAELVHQAGGLLYYDGANANALMGLVRPGDLGFDVAHFNLHKTFATPHGGGGPGAGPVGVKKFLAPYLPEPVVRSDGAGAQKKYHLASPGPKSCGRVGAFQGNIGVVIKAYAYLLSLGPAGLKAVSETAVLNANYLRNKLEKYYDIPYGQTCFHEFVISAKRQRDQHGVKALDIAKRLMDYGFHPPTIYFPLIVEEALMIEPTETESQRTLDSFIEAMIKIARECQTDPDLVRSAPHSLAISRLDEAKAARELRLRWQPAAK